MKFLKYSFFALLPAIVLFGSLELGLRLTGFEYHNVPTYLNFGFKSGIPSTLSSAFEDAKPFAEKGIRVFRPSPDLFWEPIPNTYLFNEQGFIGDRVHVGPNPHVLRIVAMGDSCTMHGNPSYPQLTKALLQEEFKNRVEVVNAGVGSYTSYQGLILFRKKILPLQPDLLLVSYVWNDHWLAFSFSDHEQKPPSPFALKMQEMLSGLKIYQLGNYIRFTFQRRVLAIPWKKKEVSFVKYRVSLPNYKDNLRKLAEEAKQAGIQVVFLTAPENFRFSVPIFLYSIGLVADLGKIDELHAQYNQAMREVAKETEVGLIDVAKKFRHMKDSEELLMLDRIHFTQKGHERLSLIIRDYLVANRKKLLP